RGRVVPRARAAGSRPARRAVSDATRVRNAEVWPELPLAAWNETRISLQLWTQMVGKTRLALAPMENHWWQVALYLTARGLTTSPIPYQGRSFEIEFDFLDHRLVMRTSDAVTQSIPLAPRSVADFYREYVGLLAA